MLSPWVMLGVFYIAAGVVEGQSHKTASGCYEVPGCPSLSLTCSADERLFPVRAQYGRLPSNCTCSTTAACVDCHLPADSQCFSDYLTYPFRQLYHGHNCWNVASCQADAEQGNTSCGMSNFAVVLYSCLQGEDVTTFAGNTTITAPAVAVHFDSSDATSYTFDSAGARSQTWHCQVDTANCVQGQADVILVREEHVRGHRFGSSSIGWSGGSNLEHVRSFQYRSFNATTPFRVSVMVGSRRYPDGWAVVRAQDGTNLTVTCGYTNINGTIESLCPGEVTTSTISSENNTTEDPGQVPPATTSIMSNTTMDPGQVPPATTSIMSNTTMDPGQVTPSAQSNQDNTTRDPGQAMATTNPNMDNTTKDPGQLTPSTKSNEDNTTEDSPVNDTWGMLEVLLALAVVVIGAVMALVCYLRREDRANKGD